ncbi:MAG: phytanoyl-CoA dioxygenase family protein [Planctomycetota bacterium]|nr:phytanoyl-CoA dioxygenase family protein [Planctomycetota bacterium]
MNDFTLSPELIKSFRENGFVRVPQIISAEEVAHYRSVIVRYLDSQAGTGLGQEPVLTQIVNHWRVQPEMRGLTFHPHVIAAAQQLTGVKLRLWHDQTLVKKPGGQPTEFHQGLPHWAIADTAHPISCWIALCDVPARKGCMSFVPGSHRYTKLASKIDVGDPGCLFRQCPDLEYESFVSVPLKAGDCTFHHAVTAHAAHPNRTDEPRYAHVVNSVDLTTTFRPMKHKVTDGLGLQPGQRLEGELFPVLDEILAALPAAAAV